MSQFAAAYNVVYDHDPELDNSYKKSPNYFQACRYGLDKASNKFIFEIYSGTLTHVLHKTCFSEDGSSQTFNVDRSFKGKAPPSRVSSKESDGFETKLDLDYIVSLVDEDAVWNEKSGSNIMWWIDVSSKKVTPSLFIKAFSLPRSVEAMFQNEVFDKDRSKRLSLSDRTTLEGDVHGLHHIKSLNLFIQTMYLEKHPVVNPHPAFFAFLPWPIRVIFTYVSNRIAFVYSLDNAKDGEFRNALERAERISSVSPS